MPGNVTAGEDYRIVDLPEQDFWLFDDSRVIHLDFDPAGDLLGIEEIEDPDLDRCRRWRDLGLRFGTPFRDWHAGA